MLVNGHLNKTLFVKAGTGWVWPRAGLEPCSTKAFMVNPLIPHIFEPCVSIRMPIPEGPYSLRDRQLPQMKWPHRCVPGPLTRRAFLENLLEASVLAFSPVKGG